MNIRSLSESREEFNTTMQLYTAVIVQTDHIGFSNDFFTGRGLILPTKRVEYTPPPWAGADYMPYFLGAYGKLDVKPKISREEIIPQLDALDKYLICDDYVSNGETFEIAMIRLTDQGVGLENIWCLSNDGFEQQNFASLDKAIKWHEYRVKRKSPYRMMLRNLGFEFPSLEV